MDLAGRLRVSRNGRFLCESDGKPYFWLADTAWELIHRLSEEEARHYFSLRARQGFNLVQTVILAELDGLHTPDAGGRLPLAGDDPRRPNDHYFLWVDRVVDMAAEAGLRLAMLPTWGDKVHRGLWGVGPIVFDTDSAFAFGHYLGVRYRDASHVLWVLGGDRPAAADAPVWDAMAAGLDKGAGASGFVTFHPKAAESSGEALHEREWLSLNMIQSGHSMRDAPGWRLINRDLERRPLKPVLDAEPCYEHHPIDPFSRDWRPEFGRFVDYDVRKAAYRAVFAGACGHTYGSHSVWQFSTPDRAPVNHPSPDWREAIHAPGAEQMIWLKRLMLSRPYFDRVPAPELLPDVPLDRETAWPVIGAAVNDDAARALRPMATRDTHGRYAMVYFPCAAQRLRVRVDTHSGVGHAWWFDPRGGQSHDAGTLSAGVHDICSPLGGPDWVLVIDDASADFGKPAGRSIA
ncbi:MAG: DUF4038 domain-containing protein [Planctomycetota bacterium]